MMLNVISKNLVREDYGTRNGIIGGGSTVISGTMGPILLAALATYFAWNSAFLLTGVLLVVLALLILFTVQEVDCEVKTTRDRGGFRGYLNSVKELFQNRAFVLCFVIGLLETTGNLCLGVFMPLYFSEVMGFDTATKGVFMSLRGMCFIPVGFLVPLLADKFPVNRVMACTFLGAFIAPAAAFLLTGTTASAYLLAVFGAWAGVTVTLFTYMIPRVALPEHLYMQSSGMILGVAVLFGGSLAPQIMSALIESGWRIEYVLGLCAGLFALCAVLSLLVNVGHRPPERA
jgi:Na+/melibiose symporter-like transporter